MVEKTIPANLLSDYILMPRSLTAANGAKTLLSGEHSESIELPCAECDPDDRDDECEMCGGAGIYIQHVPISWSRIKLIYAQAVEGLARELPSLPCDVMLPPATIIRRGCGFNTLLNSLGLREGQPDELCTIQRARPAPTEQLWAVHAQGPDELWAAESHEAAEQHAAALNALPGQTDTIKVNAIVIRSPWSEVEHWKTLAEQWRHEAEDRIASVLGMTKRLEKLEADHSLLASESMAKTLDIVAIGEALGIPGEEQQGGITEFLEAIEQLRKDAERYRWLRDHEATCIWEEDDTEVRNHPGSLDEAVDESIAQESAHA